MENFKKIKGFPKYEMNTEKVIRNIALSIEVKHEEGGYVRLMQAGNRKRMKVSELETTDEVETEAVATSSEKKKTEKKVEKKAATKKPAAKKAATKKNEKKSEEKKPRAEIKSKFKLDEKVKFTRKGKEHNGTVKAIRTYKGDVIYRLKVSEQENLLFAKEDKLTAA